MKRLLSSFLASVKKSSRSSHSPSRFQRVCLGVEGLESRDMMSVVPTFNPVPPGISGATVISNNPVPLPSTPSGFSAKAVSASEIDLSWNPVAGAPEYHIVEWNSTTNAWDAVSPSSFTTKTTFAVTNLNPDTTYYFAVDGYNSSSGYGDFSALAHATTPEGIIEVPPPNLTGNATSASSVNLTWRAVNGATAYTVQRYVNGNWTTIATVSGLSVPVSGLSAASTNYFRVAADNAAGTGVYTNWISVLTWPASPTNVVAQTASTSQINLSWSTVGGVTGYWVYYRTASSGWSLYKALAPGQTSLAVTGLTAGVTYSFEVGAFNSAGYSFSYATSATTLLGLPPAPTNFSVKALSTTLAQLTWSPVAGATGYQIYYYTSTGWQKLGTTTSTYIDYTLTHGATYYFDVAAINAAGTGPGAAYKSITM
jgi:fibronectin type 3 domain-containing protein